MKLLLVQSGCQNGMTNPVAIQFPILTQRGLYSHMSFFSQKPDAINVCPWVHLLKLIDCVA